MPLDDVEQWPQIGHLGVWRNREGHAIVSDPKGSKRTRRYKYGASSYANRDAYYGDPWYGHVGTLTHDIFYAAIQGIPRSDELIARGVELGVSEELQTHIYANAIKTREHFGVRNRRIEQVVVDDRLEVVTAVDLIDEDPDGTVHVADAKSSKDIRKLAILVQLAIGAGATPYFVSPDGPHADERRPWGDDEPVLRYGVVWHYPTAQDARKDDPNEWSSWSRVRVDLTYGFAVRDELHDIYNDGHHVHAFSPPQFATPASPPPAVESPAGDDALQGASPAVNRWASSSDTPTWDRPQPDEGNHVTPTAVARLRVRYDQLGDTRRWVGAYGQQATDAGVTFKITNDPTERRHRIMSGLIDLARNGWSNDDAVRAILRPIIGDIADAQAFSVGQLVGSLSVDEAAHFADYCAVVANGSTDMAPLDDGRVVFGMLPEVAA